jgi:AcrR family transcriptional regulator
LSELYSANGDRRHSARAASAHREDERRRPGPAEPALVQTPWGKGGELGERVMDCGPRARPGAAAQNQREQLFGAMVAVCTVRGYEATGVGEVIALAGVSRSDFHKHFADKEECFVATLEAILKAAWRVIALSYDGQGSALRALVELIVAQPAAARFCLIESYPVGAAALELLEETVAGVEALYTEAFAAREGAAQMPPGVVAAIVGGLRQVIATRLIRGREEELGALVGELWEWSIGYAAPPGKR